ncbi:MAG: transporter [Euryarchaeota archaeon]|nr:transporter [Euryarchaeota archaeon]
MFTILWQMGVLSAVLVFGVKIGLAMGFAGLSKKVAGAIALGYGVGILLLTKIASGYTDILYKVIYDYNFVIFLAMAIIIIYTGFHTIKEWKTHQKNHAKASCMAMIAPCPCCFGAVVAAIILMSPLIGASAFSIGKYAALFLSLTIGVFYLASGALIRILKKPYPVLLGNFMLFVGLYFLVSAIVLPNINTVLASKISPLNIPSISIMSYVFVMVLILMIAGIYITKKQSPLLGK